MWSYSLSFSPSILKLQRRLCLRATETAPEIYWPPVPPFDTRDTANRSCAISRLLGLPCKTDLSCLRAIFKPRASETYGTMGNFIIDALHLSDLIQARRISCVPHIYTHTHTHSATANTLAGVKPSFEPQQDYRFYLQCKPPPRC